MQKSKTLTQFLVRHRIPLFWFVLIGVALFLPFATRIRFENSIESFISPKDPDRKYYQEFKKIFGDDQMIILVIPVGEVFTKKILTELDDISDQIKDIPEVRKVRSITSTQDIVGSEGGFQVSPFIEKIPESGEELMRLRTSALKNPLYQMDLFSLDGSIASMLIETKTSQDDERYKKIYNGVRKILNSSPFKDSEYHIAGEPLVELQMTQDMWKDLGTFVPATYVCLAILLFFLFRSLQTVVIQLIVITLCLGFLVGIMGVLKITMNAVTVGLPSLVLCISVLDAIHILSLFRFHLAKGLDFSTSLHLALEESLEPCFLTSVTTVVGFISMSVSEIVPIRQFGILGAAATAAAFPICLFTLPHLMRLVPIEAASGKTAEEKNRFATFFGGLQKWHDRKILMGLGIVLLVAGSLVGLSRIRVETNNLKFLRAHSPIRKATNYIEKNLAGTTPLEITVRAPLEDMIKEPRILKQIETFQEFLVSLPEVDKTASPVQFIKEMHQAMNEENPDYYFLPDTKELVAQYLLTYSFSGRNNDLDDFLDYPYQTARIRGRVKQLSSSELKKTLRRIQEFADAHFDRDLKVRITSHSLLQANMMDALVRGQLNGLAIESLLLVLIFACVHRSLAVGFFSLIPNTIPLLACFGLMGFVDITFNAGTAMVACIAFGLVVDDTIHFFHHARENFKREKDVNVVFQKIFEVVGPAVLFSSFLLAGGFGILLFGQSYLTGYFGVLCAVTILFALLCELLITPFLLKQFPVFRRALQT